MSINNFFREHQNRLITLLGYNPNYFKLKQVENKIKEKCFPNIDLNKFSNLSTCYRLINLKNKNYLVNLPEIINETFSRLEFLDYKIDSKISSKIINNNEKLILEIYEQTKKETEIIYRINLCKKLNQKIRWIYQSINTDGVITEIENLLEFDPFLNNKKGIDKSEEISFAIICGILNEILAYLDISCSLVRVNLSEFIFIYEGQENLDIMPYLQQFGQEIIFVDIDENNQYIHEVRINTELDQQCSFELFYFFIK